MRRHVGRPFCVHLTQLGLEEFALLIEHVERDSLAHGQFLFGTLKRDFGCAHAAYGRRNFLARRDQLVPGCGDLCGNRALHRHPVIAGAVGLELGAACARLQQAAVEQREPEFRDKSDIGVAERVVLARLDKASIADEVELRRKAAAGDIDATLALRFTRAGSGDSGIVGAGDSDGFVQRSRQHRGLRRRSKLDRRTANDLFVIGMRAGAARGCGSKFGFRCAFARFSLRNVGAGDVAHIEAIACSPNLLSKRADISATDFDFALSAADVHEHGHDLENEILFGADELGLRGGDARHRLVALRGERTAGPQRLARFKADGRALLLSIIGKGAGCGGHLPSDSGVLGAE